MVPRLTSGQKNAGLIYVQFDPSLSIWSPVVSHWAPVFVGLDSDRYSAVVSWCLVLRVDDFGGRGFHFVSFVVVRRCHAHTLPSPLTVSRGNGKLFLDVDNSHKPPSYATMLTW